MTPISWIWILFILIFTLLAILNFVRSTKKVSEFQISQRPMQDGKVKVLGTDIDAPLKNFKNDINSYIHAYNQSNSKQNIISGIGFLAAAVVALFSLFIELKIIK